MSLFKVNEYSGGFEVEHIPTGKTHWMSDGVDVLTYATKTFELGDRKICAKQIGGKLFLRENDENGVFVVMNGLPRGFVGELLEWMQEEWGDEHSLSPGDPDFRQAWEDALNEDESTTLEAYFPDEVE